MIQREIVMIDPKAILNPDVQTYITAHLQADPYQLLLKKSPFEDIPMAAIVQQITGRKVAQSKFPFLLEYQQYIYPAKVSLEQATSQRVAIYKARLMEGNSMIDLTGGMGIDTHLLGSAFDDVVYVEPNPQLYKTSVHNFGTLGASHISGHNTTAEDYLNSSQKTFDWVYIDPSRRIDGDKKTSIHNYQPNVVELLPQLLSRADNVMIKLSPMQAVSDCVRHLPHIKHIYIISLKNEVKELLLILCKDHTEDPQITTVNLGETEEIFGATYRDRNSQCSLGEAKAYIYQPAPVMIKSELQDHYANSLELVKLHRNTQLYSSDIVYDNFFGRIFEVIAHVPSDRKKIRKYIPAMEAHIIAKNYPLTPDQISKKLKIQPKGEHYILAYTDVEEDKKLVLCKRL